MSDKNSKQRKSRPYANARDILPAEILRAVQSHFHGMLWVPRYSDPYSECKELVLKLKHKGVAP